MPQDVLKAVVKRDKGLLQKEMVTTHLQQKVMLHLPVIQDKIRKIAQTTHMLPDVSHQQKVMLHLLQKEMVTTHLQQKVMLHLPVIQVHRLLKIQVLLR